MSADLRAKALGYLRAGAVTIQTVTRTHVGDGLENVIVLAFVDGHNGRHVIDGRLYGTADGVREQWDCAPCKDYLEATCGHRAAVQMVTGGATEARPEPKADRRGASVAQLSR